MRFAPDRSRRLALGVGVASLALALTACGSSSSSTPPAPAGTDTAPSAAAGSDPAVVALLPQSVKDKGQLTVGMEAQYPPFDFYDTDNKTIIGLDADIAAKLATLTGLTLTLEDAAFDSIIPSLASGRYDLGISGFTVTTEREKQVDFVTYYYEGDGLLVKSGNPSGLAIDESLCGVKIAVLKGSTQNLTSVSEIDKKCAAAGKPNVVASVVPGSGDLGLAMQSGRVDGVLTDGSNAAYTASSRTGSSTSRPARRTTRLRSGSPRRRGAAWTRPCRRRWRRCRPTARTRRSWTSGGCRRGPTPSRRRSMKPLADDDAVSTGTVLTDGAASPAAALTAVPVRHPWRWVAIAVVVVLAAMLVSTLLTNPNFEWGVVRQYLTSETIINGLLMTLLLTVLVMVGRRRARHRPRGDAAVAQPGPAGASGAYIWFFRGTPVLVQLIVWFNLAALFPRLVSAIPFGPEFMRARQPTR